MSDVLSAIVLVSSIILLGAIVGLLFRKVRRLAAIVAFASLVVAGFGATALFRYAEAQLDELRKVDPKAYLSKLKSAGNPQWEAEFQKLDSAGYTRFVAERQAREAEIRRVEISTLLKGLAAMPSTDLDGLSRVYQRLNVLEPTNPEYKNRRDAVSKQIEAREEKKRLEQDQADNPERYLKIENFSWSKGGFDTIMIANFSIKNELPWPVKDVKIQCIHKAPSGTVIDQNTQVIYEIFGASQTKQQTNVSMGFIHSQVTASSCGVIGATSLRSLQAPPIAKPLLDGAKYFNSRQEASGKSLDNSVTWGAMFKQQVERCWKKPYGGIDALQSNAAFTIRLKRDGTLEGMPVSQEVPATPYLRLYQESALRAIIQCQPYNLPPAFFEEWKYFSPVFTERKQ